MKTAIHSRGERPAADPSLADPTRNPPSRHLDLGLAAPKLRGSKCLLCHPICSALCRQPEQTTAGTKGPRKGQRPPGRELTAGDSGIQGDADGKLDRDSGAL